MSAAASGAARGAAAGARTRDGRRLCARSGADALASPLRALLRPSHACACSPSRSAARADSQQPVHDGGGRAAAAARRCACRAHLAHTHAHTRAWHARPRAPVGRGAAGVGVGVCATLPTLVLARRSCAHAHSRHALSPGAGASAAEPPAPEDGEARMRRVLAVNPCTAFKKRGNKTRRASRVCPWTANCSLGSLASLLGQSATPGLGRHAVRVRLRPLRARKPCWLPFYPRASTHLTLFRCARPPAVFCARAASTSWACRRTPTRPSCAA
jgi:hypothetical protein